MTSSLARAPSYGVSDLEHGVQAAARMLDGRGQRATAVAAEPAGRGRASVGALSKHAKLAKSAASQHSATLWAEDLVAPRREAQTIVYRLADPAAIRVLDPLCDIYRG